MKKARENLALYVLMAVCFGVFCFMGWRYVDVEFLALTNGDAMPQFLQLQKMYQGLITLNVRQFFAFEFYNYGFFYYVLNLLATLPFIITENYPLQIYAPRVLNALFSIANIWLLYRIARIYLSALDSMLIAGIFVAMGGFWHLGYVFKPDVFQGFFVLACAYYLLRDNFSFGKHYTLAWIALGLGMGVAKFQAILFIPMVYAYIFLCMREQGLWRSVKRAIVASIGIFALWIATNPYLLHTSGFNAWLSMFEGNMRSNATNHGAYTQVSLSDKLAMIDYYYFEVVVFIVLLLLCCYLLWLGCVGFLAKNGDCCGESAVTYDQVCALDSPCKVPFLAQKSCRTDTTIESTFENNSTIVQKVDSSNATILKQSAKDSRIFAHNAQNVAAPQAVGFCDDFGGFQGGGKGAYLAYVTAAAAAESAKSAQKPTPKPSKAQSLIPFTPLAAGFLVSLAYLLFFVNKAWEAYYFSTIALGCVLCIPLALLVAKTSKGGGQHRKKLYQTATLSLLLALQILGGLMSSTYEQVFTKYYANLDSAYALSDELIETLRPLITDTRATILSECVNFAYLSLGLKPTNIYYPYNFVYLAEFIYEEWAKKPRKSAFIPKDFIVLYANIDRYFPHQESQETYYKIINGIYPYKIVAQSEHFIILANTDSTHSNILHKEQ